MSTRNNKAKVPPVGQSPSIPCDPHATVPLTLRMPECLKVFAEDCAMATGSSLNGLICTALAEYLAQRGYRVYSR